MMREHARRFHGDDLLPKWADPHRSRRVHAQRRPQRDRGRAAGTRAVAAESAGEHHLAKAAGRAHRADSRRIRSLQSIPGVGDYDDSVSSPEGVYELAKLVA